MPPRFDLVPGLEEGSPSTPNGSPYRAEYFILFYFY